MAICLVTLTSSRGLSAIAEFLVFFHSQTEQLLNIVWWSLMTTANKNIDSSFFFLVFSRRRSERWSHRELRCILMSISRILSSQDSWHWNKYITISLATANRSRISIRGRMCKICLTSSLIMWSSVVVSRTVCAHEEVPKIWGTLGSTRWDGIVADP